MGDQNIKDYRTIRFTVENQIALLQMNRPESRNALSLEMRAEIADAVNRIRDDDNIRALVITGSGGSFCAGGDIKSLSEGFSVSQGRKRIQALHQWYFHLSNLEKPVIAAVDGPATGAGFNLALCCDFIFASERARFSQIFGRIGLVPDLGGFYFLPRIVGLAKAKELMFTARMIGAEEAKELGIVYRICPHETLVREALKFAERFLDASPDAIGMAKAILNQSFQLDQRALWEMEAFAQALAFQTPYYQEAIRKFLNKEPLSFVWENYDSKSN